MSRLWDQPMGGWLGGDGAFTLDVGHGRVLWIFGDSLIQRDDATWMAHNVALLQRADGSLRMVGPTAKTHEPFASPPPTDDSWFWPNAAVRVDNRIWLFFSETRAAGSGMFGFDYVQTWLGELSTRSWTVMSLRRVPDASEIAWGAAVVVARRYLYVFGIHDRPTAKYVHLARVPRATWPRGPWRYFERGAWRASPQPNGEIIRDAASEISVLRVRDGFALLTHDPWLGPYVRYQRAHALTGPWTAPRELLTTPTPAGTFTYNTVAHPEFSGPGLLVSWNTGLTDGTWWPDDLTLIRPQFAWVAWNCLGGRPYPSAVVTGPVRSRPRS